MEWHRKRLVGDNMQTDATKRGRQHRRDVSLQKSRHLRRTAIHTKRHLVPSPADKKEEIYRAKGEETTMPPFVPENVKLTMPSSFFRANMTPLEIWETLTKLATRPADEYVPDLLADPKQLDFVAEGLRQKSISLQLSCLAILAAVTKKADGCELFMSNAKLPHMLHTILHQAAEYGIEVTNTTLAVIGNVAMENGKLRNRLLPVLKDIANGLCIPSVPRAVVHKSMQVLRQAVSEASGYDHDMCDLLKSVCRRTMCSALKDDIVMLQHTFGMLNGIVTFTKDPDSFLGEDSELIRKSFSLFEMGYEPATHFVALLSEGTKTWPLVHGGFFRKALDLLAATSMTADDVRMKAAHIVGNVLAVEDVFPHVYNHQVFAVLLDTFSKETNSQVLAPISFALHQALAGQRDKKSVQLLAEKTALLPNLFKMVDACGFKNRELLQNSMTMLYDLFTDFTDLLAPFHTLLTASLTKSVAAFPDDEELCKYAQHFLHEVDLTVIPPTTTTTSSTANPTASKKSEDDDDDGVDIVADEDGDQAEEEEEEDEYVKKM